ncbi:hypothetical protein LCGC14_1105710 [marine sediment metagenome]|uniref:OmpR/PhoB-type domain-containing protein n=1 Tax=marine sediment metagenome TaxID=412755 RepID=A0A0F9QEG8_9ZZZZ
MTLTVIIIPYPPSINGVRLTERQSEIIFALADGRWHSAEQIIDIIYPTGAIRPTSCINLIASHVCALRKIIKHCRIENDHRSRFRLIND